MKLILISAAFTPGASLAGGLLIGVAATFHLACNGRLTGLSSIIRGSFTKGRGFRWKSTFLGGLGCGAVLWDQCRPNVYGPVIEAAPSASILVPAIAGVLVGAGTTLANGCTSGHGVCGLPRLSLRSFAAVGMFMATGVATAVAASRTNSFGLASVLRISTERSPLVSTAYAAAVLVLPMLALSKALRGLVDLPAEPTIKDASAEPLVAAKPTAPRLEEDSFSSLMVALTSGLIFAGGLGLSGMTNPAKVTSFLDVASVWDPSLACVMAGAVCLNLATFHVIYKWKQPLVRRNFEKVTNTTIDAKLLIGSAIFGIGWGLGGICPGPGFMALATGKVPFAIWQAASLLGSYTAERLLSS